MIDPRSPFHDPRFAGKRVLVGTPITYISPQIVASFISILCVPIFKTFAVSSWLAESNCLHAKKLSCLPGLSYLPRRDISPHQVVLPTSRKRVKEFCKQMSGKISRVGLLEGRAVSDTPDHINC